MDMYDTMDERKTEIIYIRVKPSTKKKWEKLLRMAKAIDANITADDLLTEALDYLRLRLRPDLRKIL